MTTMVQRPLRAASLLSPYGTFTVRYAATLMAFAGYTVTNLTELPISDTCHQLPHQYFKITTR